MWLLQGIYAYVTLDEGVETSEELRKELINAVRNEIGAFGERACTLACGGARSLHADALTLSVHHSVD